MMMTMMTMMTMRRRTVTRRRRTRSWMRYDPVCINILLLLLLLLPLLLLLLLFFLLLSNLLSIIYNCLLLCAHVQDDKDSIEAIFLGVVQNMKLNHLETAALRLAIARDDKSIRACLEDFRKNRSEARLMEGLHTIARSTIDTTLLEAGYDGLEGDMEAGEGDGEEREWMNQQDDENDDEDDEDEDDEDEDEDEDSDEDSEEEEQAGGLMSTQATRERVFPLLISELSKESILSAEEARKLYKLFIEKNDVLNSALDVYDLDNNIAELVDTMLRLAKVSN
jgi:hypothetical protein